VDDLVVAVALVVLASTLVAAAGMKLLAPPRHDTLLAGLAVRSPGAALAVALLPYGELALAVSLTMPGPRRAAAFGCAGLLAAASGLLVVRRARGDHRACGCFGSVRDGRLGVARNAGLMAAAAVVALAGDAGAPPGVLLLATLAVAGVAVSALLAHELRVADRRNEALGDHEWLDVPLATTDGGTMSVRRWLGAGRTLLIVFVDPLCAPCRSLLPELADRQRTSAAVGVGIVSRGPASENAALAREFGLAPIAVQASGELAQLLGISATPAALLLSAEGRPLAGPTLGRAAILALLDAAPGPTPDSPLVVPM
jgi:hypothetical protein